MSSLQNNIDISIKIGLALLKYRQRCFCQWSAWVCPLFQVKCAAHGCVTKVNGAARENMRLCAVKSNAAW